MEKLTNHFNTKVETQRLEYEDQIKSQITNTLHKIYDKITVNTNQNGK
jgi:hypothetical protein